MAKVVTAVTALVLTVSLGACTTEAEEPAAPESSPGSRAASPSETPPDDTLPCVPGVGTFTGPAADELGAERVMAAYCLLAELVERQGRTSLARPIPFQQAADVISLREHLTPRAAAGWAGLVRARTAGDPDATARVSGLTLHDVRQVPSGYVGADDGPYVFGTQLGPATAALTRGGEALELTFTLDTGLVLEQKGDESGRHALLPVTRQATYVLVPDGDGWLIDDWRAAFEHGRVRLVSG